MRGVLTHLKKAKNFRRKCPEHPSPDTISRLKYLKFQTDKKFVDLRLTANKKDEISKCHLFVVIPWYYSVKTRFFKNIHRINSRPIKDIHYSYLRGKNKLTLSKTHYNQNDFEDLKEYGIPYKVIKYRVFL